MFKKILVAMDSSDLAEKIFERAMFLAKMTHANLILVHVLSAEEEGSPGLPIYGVDHYQMVTEAALENYREQWEAFQKQQLQWLQAHVEQAMAEGVKAEFSQYSGSPGRMICEAAKNWQADLVVIGRRGRSGLSEFLLGSVSNYVLHHAPCSVMVVQALEQATASVVEPTLTPNTA